MALLFFCRWLSAHAFDGGTITNRSARANAAPSAVSNSVLRKDPDFPLCSILQRVLYRHDSTVMHWIVIGCVDSYSLLLVWLFTADGRKRLGSVWKFRAPILWTPLKRGKLKRLAILAVVNLAFMASQVLLFRQISEIFLIFLPVSSLNALVNNDCRVGLIWFQWKVEKAGIFLSFWLFQTASLSRNIKFNEDVDRYLEKVNFVGMAYLTWLNWKKGNKRGTEWPSFAEWGCV